MPLTNYARLVETKLRNSRRLGVGEGLNDWLRLRRNTSPPTPWRTIALEIARVTGETPTDVTVSSWYDEPAKQEDQS